MGTAFRVGVLPRFLHLLHLLKVLHSILKVGVCYNVYAISFVLIQYLVEFYEEIFSEKEVLASWRDIRKICL